MLRSAWASVSPKNRFQPRARANENTARTRIPLSGAIRFAGSGEPFLNHLSLM